MPNRALVCTLFLALALAPLVAQPGPDKEELKLKLPKPMFVGTPTNIKSANLGPITGKPRPPFYVPKGTVLRVTSWHDNTAANKDNPDPNQWVGWGDRTVDEMAHAWVNITYMSDEDYKTEVEKRKAARPTDDVQR